MLVLQILPYRDTSLIRERTSLGPYRRPMPRVLGGSLGGGRFLVGEVHLKAYGSVPGECVIVQYRPPSLVDTCSLLLSSLEMTGPNVYEHSVAETPTAPTLTRTHCLLLSLSLSVSLCLSPPLFLYLFLSLSLYVSLSVSLSLSLSLSLPAARR